MRNSLLLGGLGLVLVAVGLSLWAYPLLPDRVPTHWNLAGHANGYSPRLVAVMLVPAIAAFVLALTGLLPAISPRGFRLNGAAADAYYEAMVAVLAMLVAIHFVVLRAEVTRTAPPTLVIVGLIGLLLVVLGILIGKVPRNFFMGVRTPWTLASDEVWRRTNRLGGRLMIAGGLTTIAVSVLPVSWTIGVLIAVIAVGALVPVVYSYVLYKRIEGFGD
jgi:immunity protein, SdpI family